MVAVDRLQPVAVGAAEDVREKQYATILARIEALLEGNYSHCILSQRNVPA